MAAAGVGRGEKLVTIRALTHVSIAGLIAALLAAPVAAEDVDSLYDWHVIYTTFCGLTPSHIVPMPTQESCEALAAAKTETLDEYSPYPSARCRRLGEKLADTCSYCGP